MAFAVSRTEAWSFLVSSSDSPLSAIDNFFFQRRSLHPGSNLRERLFPRRRSVVAEWRKTTIVGRSKLFYWNISRRLQDPVANFLRVFDPRVNRGNDSDEYPVLGFKILSDDL